MSWVHSSRYKDDKIVAEFHIPTGTTSGDVKITLEEGMYVRGKYNFLFIESISCSTIYVRWYEGKRKIWNYTYSYDFMQDALQRYNLEGVNFKPVPVDIPWETHIAIEDLFPAYVWKENVGFVQVPDRAGSHSVIYDTYMEYVDGGYGDIRYRDAYRVVPISDYPAYIKLQASIKERTERVRDRLRDASDSVIAAGHKFDAYVRGKVTESMAIAPEKALLGVR